MTRKKNVEEQEVKTTEAVQETEGAEEIMTGEVQETPPVRTGVVIGGNLNIREAPALEAPKVGLLENGAEVTILGEQDGWYQVANGFVKGQFIKLTGGI